MRERRLSLPAPRLVACALVAAATALAACEREPGDDAAPQVAAEPAAADVASPAPGAPKVLGDDEVQRLKALGYVDVGDEPPDARGSGVVLHDAGRSWPGYNLFTNAFTCTTEIVDAGGRVVHRWSREPCFRWDNTTLLEDGDLLVVGRDKQRDPDRAVRGSRWKQGQHLARLAWDGTLRWEKRINAHHDSQPTPDGRISVLTGEDRVIPEIDPEQPISFDKLTILTPEGEVVEEAQLYEMLREAPGFRILPRPSANSDLIHANSIDWMRRPELAARHPLYAPGNVLVSMRHQDAIAIIDWKKREVVWHWGQGELSGPHDAQVLPSGNILVFDNGIERKWSRVLELDPVSRHIVWQWKAEDPPSFFTLSRGSNQRLPNGNTLIAESDSGRAFEIAPSGELVWEFLNPSLHEGKRVAIVRMRRLESDTVARLLAGGAAPAARAAGAPASAAR